MLLLLLCLCCYAVNNCYIINTKCKQKCFPFNFYRSPFLSHLLRHAQRVPKGLEDVSRYPYLFAELLADSDRWTEEDIAKLAGKNLIRVFRHVEQVSEAFKAQLFKAFMNAIIMSFTGTHKMCALTKAINNQNLFSFFHN